MFYGSLLGYRLRELRDKRHMTLIALAKEAKISFVMLADIEHGRDCPDHLDALAKALHTDVKELRAMAGKPLPSLKKWIEENPCLVAILRNRAKDGTISIVNRHTGSPVRYKRKVA